MFAFQIIRIHVNEGKTKYVDPRAHIIPRGIFINPQSPIAVATAAATATTYNRIISYDFVRDTPVVLYIICTYVFIYYIIYMAGEGNFPPADLLGRIRKKKYPCSNNCNDITNHVFGHIYI